MKFNRKTTAIITLTVIGSMLLTGCDNAKPLNEQSKPIQTNNSIVEKVDLLSELNNAKEVIVKEKFISLGAGYDVYADNKHVGEIKGKYINVIGDVFELKDIYGNVVKSEKQIKRWGIKLNRLAEVYDKDNNVSGYIGEDKIKDMFSWGYKFHFYDKTKNEIGYTSEQFLSLTDSYKVYDLENNLDYEIEGDFLALMPTFNINVNDTSNIPIEDVVFYTAIQNEISKSSK